MRQDIAWVFLAFALMAPVAQAQESPAQPRLAVSLGLVSDGPHAGYGGLHGGIALRQRVSPSTVIQAEGIVAEGEVRGLATVVSMEFRITESWYGIAGGGAYFDNGTNSTWVSGVGHRLGSFGGRLSMELRYVSMDDGGLYWSIERALF